MNDSDLQLLARYTEQRAEDAFSEIVRRHVDLVYSAALRQVRSLQLAEEVSQSVFTDLARNAGKLKSDTILTAWLYQVTRRTAIDVVRREARRQLREQIATQMNAMNATATDWTYVEPLLDEAVSTLDETDRAAVLLRYFENKSLREVGATLGTSDDAAQKRVSRAVECLREYFAKRGITVGASGLVVVISANAVQAAPVGLAVTISTAVALTGTTVVATATASAFKVIAMTTLQKALITTTVVVLAGAGIYEATQNAKLRDQVQTLRQQQSPLAEQVQHLQQNHDSDVRELSALRADNERLSRNTSELLRLRGEAAQLRETKTALERVREENQRLRASEQTAAAATSDEANPQPLFTRLFAVSSKEFMENLNQQVKAEENESVSVKLLKLFEQNGVSFEPPASLYFNDAKGQILVRNTLTNMDVAESIITFLNSSK